MIKHIQIPTIETQTIENKKVLIRVDFDVTLSHNKIADDTRIQQSLPTIKYLLKHHNKLILISKLNRPKTRDNEHSMKHVIKDVEKYLPGYTIRLVDDFLDPSSKNVFDNQTQKEILMLENIRFYPEEKKGDKEFAKKLAALADIYVDDAFAMMHRTEASVVEVPKFLPSFAGLLVVKETDAIDKLLHSSQKPVVSIIGGAKIPDKLAFLSKLIEISDYLIVGGGIANTMLLAKGFEIGKSLCDRQEKKHVEDLFSLAQKHHTEIILPKDVVGLLEGKEHSQVFPVEKIPASFQIFDIGPETQAIYGNIIANAKTIIWNGPVGYMEDERFQRGTDFLYYSIAQNTKAYSLVGGGDTLAAISKKEYLDHITHISTGGGAMLELIENGTLPGLEALRARHD